VRWIARLRVFLLESHKAALAAPADAGGAALADSGGAALAGPGGASLGRFEILVWCSFAAYLISVALAVMAGRHLYADGTLGFLDILSGGPFPMVPGGWAGLYTSRFGQVIYVQMPPRLAAWMGLRDLRALSLIFGAVLYGFKPLGLAVCYRYARDKRYLLFPLLALFAGAINTEAFILRENQMLMGLFWPALFITLFAESITGWTLAVYVLIGAPLILCYESMVFFGVVLCAACVYRLAVGASRSPVDRRVTLAALVWFAMGAVIAACSILLPRVPGNRESALMGFKLLVHPDLGTVLDHVGLRMSCVVLVLVAAIAVCRTGSRLVWWLAAAALAPALYIPAYIWLHPSLTSLNAQMFFRTLDVPVVLAAAAFLFATLLGLLPMDAAKYRALFLVVAALGIGQSLWSAMATGQWMGAVALFRDDLSRHTGVVPYEQSVASRLDVGGLPVAHMLGEPQWPVLPMSIAFAEGGNVRSIVVMRKGIYRPYDPWNPATLPDLRRYGIHYDEFVKALGRR